MSSGRELIVVFAAAVSTVQPYDTVGPVFPAGSIARTWKVCGVGEICEYPCGDVQAANEALSSLHWKVEPASFVENVKPGSRLLVGSAGFEPIVASGAVMSTSHAWWAALASTLPAASV